MLATGVSGAKRDPPLESRLNEGVAHDFSRAIHVDFQLSPERIGAVEALGAANSFHEFDLQLLAVEIACIVDEMNFDLPGVIAERRIRSDMHGCRDPIGIDAANAGVDAVAREHDGNLVEIGRREADPLTAPRAVSHSPPDRVTAGQHLVGVDNAAFCESAADVGGGDHLSPRIDRRRNDIKLHGVPLTESRQRMDVAGPSVAKAKIRSFHQAAGLQLIANHELKKLIRRELEQVPIRRECDHAIDAVLPEKSGLVLNGRQPRRDASGSKDGCGRRVERQDDGGRAVLVSARFQGLRDLLVPPVNAVEIPDRDITSAVGVWSLKSQLHVDRHVLSGKACPSIVMAARQSVTTSILTLGKNPAARDSIRRKSSLRSLPCHYVQQWLWAFIQFLGKLMSIRPIEWIGDEYGHLRLLDQTRLPTETAFVDCKTSRHVWNAIHILQVRGAPAIGVAAAYGVVLGLQPHQPGTRKEFNEAIGAVVTELAGSRPTAVNLFWALERMRQAAAAFDSEWNADRLRHLFHEAQAIEAEDRAMCAAIGRHGAPFLRGCDGVLTHCNTGALATAGDGTALAVIFEAVRQGQSLHVYADETRPLWQGARLTAWELVERGIPCTVICDSMAGWVMRQRRVQAVIVGADRIAANGDTANKIGTYSVATLAKAHGIPFFVAAPTSTFDLSLATGDSIPIEERAREEIASPAGRQLAPAGAGVYNPAFDVTPAELITAIVTERGVIFPVTSAAVRDVAAPRGRG